MPSYILVTATKLILPGGDEHPVQAAVLSTSDDSVVAHGDLRTLLVAYPEVPVTDLGDSTVELGHEDLRTLITSANRPATSDQSPSSAEQEE